MQDDYQEVSRCRVGGHSDLVTVLSLGEQALTGVFPSDTSEKIATGPLDLAWSPNSGLLQLRHSYPADQMYGDNYGYRSGLNQSMVDHLTQKASYLARLAHLSKGDVVVDIGSNDATSLKAYDGAMVRRVGIDPTAEKFSRFYPDDILRVADFFSSRGYADLGLPEAKIISSIAMFYDLEDPVAFAREVADVLAPDGVWHFEQSYMPSMLRLNSYDTICHEHIEYYSLKVVRSILDKAGLKIVDVVMNNVNGGSFAVTATKRANQSLPVNQVVIDWLLKQEDRMGLDTLEPYKQFETRVHHHREDLTSLIKNLVADGKKVFGYGASTKGNVILQFCGLSAAEIPMIAEVNEEKFGKLTPGSHIPIVSEAEARAQKPDYFLVLPWHFKEGIVRREAEFLGRGGNLIFPFPEVEII